MKHLRKILLYSSFAAVLVTGGIFAANAIRPDETDQKSEVVLNFCPVQTYMRMTVEEITDEYVEGTVYLISNETNLGDPEIPFKLGQKVKINYGELVCYTSDVTAAQLEGMEEISIAINGSGISISQKTAEAGFSAYAREIQYDTATDDWYMLWDELAERAEENDGLFFYDPNIRY